MKRRPARALHAFVAGVAAALHSPRDGPAQQPLSPEYRLRSTAPCARLVQRLEGFQEGCNSWREVVATATASPFARMDSDPQLRPTPSLGVAANSAIAVARWKKAGTKIQAQNMVVGAFKVQATGDRPSDRYVGRLAQEREPSVLRCVLAPATRTSGYTETGQCGSVARRSLPCPRQKSARGGCCSHLLLD